MRLCSEPFRLFFPIGVVLGFVGVGIWPAYQWGMIDHISGVVHSRLQIQSFLSFFVAGFLLTAIPRLLDSKKAQATELGIFALILLGSAILQIMGRPLLGDAVYLLFFLALLLFARKRFGSREDLPPPFFVFLPIGLLHGFAGTVFMILGQLPFEMEKVYLWGQDLLYQGFVLSLILGIGSFLGPRFLGFPPSSGFAGAKTPPKEWRSKALRFATLGLVLFLSFAVEHFLDRRLGTLLRAGVVTWMVVGQIPLFRRANAPGLLPQALKASYFSILLSAWGLLLFPSHRVAVLHILYIGGFGLLTFVVATRVTLGHSGFEHLFQRRLLFVGIMAALMLGSMVLRFLADLQPERYFQFLSMAGVLWILAAGLWLVLLMPILVQPKPEAGDSC